MSIEIKNGGGGRGVLTPEVEALGKSYFGDSFNKDALRLLPYIWNRTNETEGVLDVCRINVEEFDIILEWRAKGFLEIIGRGSTKPSLMRPHTDTSLVKFDKRQLTVKVSKSFYDKMINVLILADYISEHNRREIGMSGKEVDSKTGELVSGEVAG